MNKFLIAFFVAVGLVTWQEIKCCRDLPWPPRYVYTGLTFGLLDLVSLADEDLAGVIAIGFVLAIALQLAGSTTGSTRNPFTTPQCNHQSTAQPSTTADLSGGLPQGTTVAGNTGSVLA